ncbi:hypothetical protein [Aerobium aerolatum]|uniref:Helix-turn-helix domain-containing protein n=1 Tax=Aquamicrobium aerolatum DSM 21857 TaxID=1121003 RepID=A0A1I3SIP1_9HYPH|nr:hypothetical protein [Aquamicrobium aerolatum]SFJ58280.1 hypothetical protein SAMN03080618_03377 [Aquamicrobium aerolatum DSM 21857]
MTAASKAPVARRRIEFRSADAARFNALREEWRVAASGRPLPKVAHKLASLLPGYVSREYGYAFPTDEQLAGLGKCSTRLIGKGMLALERAGLIERQTIVRRDEKGEAAGRIRRIYLTMPSERNTFMPEVNGTEVNGTPEVNGTNWVSERNPVFRIYPDRTTPDNKSSIERKVSSYAPTREGFPIGYADDDDFLDAFDRALIETARINPTDFADLERLVQQAFDRTTDKCEMFMPFHWRDVRALRSGDTAEWFRRRADQLIERRAA